MSKGRVHDLLSDQGLLKHELLSVAEGSKSMLRGSMMEQATKDPIGSLIPSFRVTQVANSYFNYRPDHLTLQGRILLAEDTFATLAKEATEKAKKTVLQNALASPFTQHLERGQVEAMVKRHDNSYRLQEMIKAYDEAQANYKTYRKAKKDLALAAEVNFNREQKKKHRNKLKGGKKVLSAVMKQLLETEMGERYTQEFAWLFDCQFDSK
ncbi:MAG: hypothetical protein SGARI_007290, partial [Bacillariaceae sp.]